MKLFLITLSLILSSFTGYCQKVAFKKNVVIGLFDNKQEFQGFLTNIADDIDSLLHSFLTANSGRSPFGNYDSSKVRFLKPVISVNENEASLKIETGYIVVDLLKKVICDDCNGVLSNVVSLHFSHTNNQIAVGQEVFNSVLYSSICWGSKRKKEKLKSMLLNDVDFIGVTDNLENITLNKLERKISSISNLSDYNSQYLSFSDLVFSIDSVRIQKDNIYLNIALSFMVD